MSGYSGRHRVPSTPPITPARSRRSARPASSSAAPLVLASTAPRRHRHHLGPSAPAARAAATGPSTPATATTAACSSRRAPGAASAAAQYAVAAPPGLPRRADRDRREGPRRPGLGRLAGVLQQARSDPCGRPRACGRQPVDVPQRHHEGEEDDEDGGGRRQAHHQQVGEEVRHVARRLRPLRGPPGDTLSAIAHRKGVRGGWHALYKANQRGIGSNPNLIYVGQRLRLPR